MCLAVTVALRHGRSGQGDGRRECATPANVRQGGFLPDTPHPAAFWRTRFASRAAVLKKRPGTGWITSVLVYVHSQKQARPKRSR